MRHAGIARPFADRRAAGRELAARLATYAGQGRPIALGLPRGGVPVAAQVAAALGWPLDVLLVRKIGVPGHRELAMGAVAAAAGVQVTVRNPEVLADLGAGADEDFARVEQEERAELGRRQLAYREQRPPVPLEGRTAVLVDDGLATGATMRAAATVVKRLAPARVVVAVPVGAAAACAELRRLVDDVVCLRCPEPFRAVGFAYRDFTATTDDEVRTILAGSI